ncbi:MAG TPA: hypothetical protein VFM28_10250 [Nitrososphaeraceae archaeon]|nr:hypothetical protein [Nitrososphaeraceae archaeon]
MPIPPVILPSVMSPPVIPSPPGIPPVSPPSPCANTLTKAAGIPAIKANARIDEIITV